MKAFSKFLIKEAILTGFIGIVAFVLFQTVLKDYYHSVFWLNLIIITVLTGVFHFSVLKSSDKEHTQFSARFMSVAGIKMLIYLIFIVVYALFNPGHAKFFLITFLILYFIYSFFEVFLMIKIFNKK